MLICVSGLHFSGTLTEKIVVVVVLKIVHENVFYVYVAKHGFIPDD